MEATGPETFRRSAFTAFVAIVGIVIYAAVKMYNTRKLFNDLRKQGLVRRVDLPHQYSQA